MITLCPISLAVGCQCCPVFKLCPAKGIIGNYGPSASSSSDSSESEDSGDR
ncbi:MAG: hypothetical protein K2X66_08000 [Cyanobacteria bacterium]|nr:hypothetical protein [Cyanobacteriota bacterium]